jgi:tRNA-dihydrouridine synthase A
MDSIKPLQRAFCVAPMLDWTDRHTRYLLRLISHHAVLYTEMVTTGALLHGDPARWLDYNNEEHPVALQLGGSHPADLARCAKLAEQWQYDEVNLNVGCPSDRVQEGAFGACLMANPTLVGDCVKAMQDACSLPVTVKCRIGIDDQDDYHDLQQFIESVHRAGCEIFIIHARKAWLKGLSPKENREIPPLNYPRVHQLKQEFPQLEVIINGGLTTLDDCVTQMQHVDGVMVGREAYHNPMLLADVDLRLYGDDHPPATREDVIHKMIEYVSDEYRKGLPIKHITRHMLGLFHGIPGGRRWRRILSEQAPRSNATPALLMEALQAVYDTPSSKESHDNA